MKTSFTLLNDDVLLLIFSYLYGEDALNVALTSSRLRDLAVPRIASRATCWCPPMIRALCEYMLSGPGPHPRARHLQLLVVTPLALSSIASCTDSIPYVNLLSNVLQEAHGLRELQLRVPFELCRQLDPRIGPALSSLTALTNLELTDVHEGTLPLLQRVGSLHSLVLHFRDTTTQYSPASTILLTMIRTVSHLRRLRKLDIRQFQPPPSEDGELPSIPRSHTFSVTDLSILEATTPALHLVDLCPGLTHLTLSFSGRVNHRMRPFVSGNRIQWPPLECLSISTQDLDLCDIGRFGTVVRLGLRDAAFDARPNHDSLSRVLPTLSPATLSLRASFGRDSLSAWTELSTCKYRVHTLDVDVTPPAYRPWSEQWKGQVSKALSGLPVVSLRLIVRTTRILWAAGAASESIRAGDGAVYRRKEMVSTIMRMLFDTLPTLRVLAIAEEAIQGVHIGFIGASASASTVTKARGRYDYMNADFDVDTRLEDGWDALDRATSQVHWWCRLENGRGAVRVPERDGERVYRAIEATVTSRSSDATVAEIDKLVSAMSL